MNAKGKPTDRSLRGELVKSITVGVLAYNEQDNLQATIDTIEFAARNTKAKDYEILIVDDGSSDNTPQVIRDLEKQNRRIRSVRHTTNAGIGAAIKTLIREADAEKLFFVPGDNILTKQAIVEFFRNSDKADIVFTFYINKENRSRFRILLSYMFNIICTFAYNVHVNYLNGSGVYNLAMLRQINIVSNGYFICAEMNLKLLFSGASFYEIGVYLKQNTTKSNAIKMKNLVSIMYHFIRLFLEIKLIRRSQFWKKPRRVLDPLAV